MLGKVLSMVLGGGGSNNKLAQYADNTLTEITAEDLKDVSNINAYAFINCNKLTSVTIPDSVTTIGEYAFMQCTELSSIILIPTIPPTLGDMAFASVPSTAVFTVPKGTLDAYKIASGWSSYKNQMVEAAD